MKCHHPDVFCCALLNAQPMGFYAPAQIVRDAQAHGVEIRPVCVNTSRWDCTLEPADGRLPGGSLGHADGEGAIECARGGGRRCAWRSHLGSVDELWRRARVPPAALERLAEADAFQDLGLERRAALVGDPRAA